MQETSKFQNYSTLSLKSLHLKTRGVSKALYKSFKEETDAIAYLQKNSNTTKKRDASTLFFSEKKLKTSNSVEITIHYDGGSRGNGQTKSPVAGAGAAIEVTVTKNGVSTHRTIRVREYLPPRAGFEMTNNYAEYSGLVAGLREAKSIATVEGCAWCRVLGDSLLVS